MALVSRRRFRDRWSDPCREIIGDLQKISTGIVVKKMPTVNVPVRS